MGPVNPFEVFRDRASDLGLNARECTDCHWQVKANGVTVNVWPQAGGMVKFLLQSSPAGTKARLESIDDALKLCGRHAAATPPVNGKPKAEPAKQELPPRSRLVIERQDNGSFLVVSHGDAIDEITFDEMLGVVINLFHTPKISHRAEDLFEAEKRSRLRRQIGDSLGV